MTNQEMPDEGAGARVPPEAPKGCRWVWMPSTGAWLLAALENGRAVEVIARFVSTAQGDGVDDRPAMLALELGYLQPQEGTPRVFISLVEFVNERLAQIARGEDDAYWQTGIARAQVALSELLAALRARGMACAAALIDPDPDRTEIAWRAVRAEFESGRGTPQLALATEAWLGGDAVAAMAAIAALEKDVPAPVSTPTEGAPLRAGQQVFEALALLDPAFAESIRGGPMDPFHRNDRIPACLEAWRHAAPAVRATNRHDDRGAEVERLLADAETRPGLWVHPDAPELFRQVPALARDLVAASAETSAVRGALDAEIALRKAAEEQARQRWTESRRMELELTQARRNAQKHASAHGVLRGECARLRQELAEARRSAMRRDIEVLHRLGTAPSSDEAEPEGASAKAVLSPRPRLAVVVGSRSLRGRADARDWILAELSAIDPVRVVTGTRLGPAEEATWPDPWAVAWARDHGREARVFALDGALYDAFDEPTEERWAPAVVAAAAQRVTPRAWPLRRNEAMMVAMAALAETYDIVVVGALARWADAQGTGHAVGCAGRLSLALRTRPFPRPEVPS